jgi:hypothetical protein
MHATVVSKGFNYLLIESFMNSLQSTSLFVEKNCCFKCQYMFRYFHFIHFDVLVMSFRNYTCPESIQNIEDNNVSNVIIIQKANIKSSVGQHRPPKNAKV